MTGVLMSRVQEKLKDVARKPKQAYAESDFVNRIVTINGADYKLTRALPFAGDVAHPFNKYEYFDAETVAYYLPQTVAYYRGYWGVGDNFYAAAQNLETQIFAAYRTVFLGLVKNKSDNYGK